MRRTLFARFRSLLALGLAAVCTLCAGCGHSAVSAAGSADLPAPSPPPQRSDIAYSDMRYEPYDSARFTALADAVSAFAGGGSEADFYQAAQAAEKELAYIYTLVTLMDLQNSSHPTDSGIAQEYLSINHIYNVANDAYWTAMHTVAVSGHAELLDADYASWQKTWFQNYDPSDTDAKQTLNHRESALEKEYEALISADEVDYDAVCDLFVQLVQLRQQIAKQSGYDSYADYAYDSVYTRSYKPSDVEALWESARQSFIPLIARYAEDISDRADALYTGDTLDCTPEAILSAMGTATAQMSPQIDEGFQYLRQYGLCDISQDNGKLETGYTTYLYAYQEPFIFNAASGTYYDYTDLFHEFGHYINYYLCGSDLLFGMPDYDLSELQSQGMEVMFFPYYDQIFGADNGDALRASVLLNLLYSVTDGAMYDEFLQKVYQEPDLTAQRVQELYQEVYESYGYEPYDGFQEEWMDVVHNFEEPFYYISYGVSALSALELFSIQQEDPTRATDLYWQIASMNTEDCYFTDALQAAGLSDVFSNRTCQKIAKALEKSGAL